MANPRPSIRAGTWLDPSGVAIHQHTVCVRLLSELLSNGRKQRRRPSRIGAVVDSSGGADRDRTDDLLSAISASVSGHTRIPPSESSPLIHSSDQEKLAKLTTISRTAPRSRAAHDAFVVANTNSRHPTQ
jgi:hypothetical protein